MADVIVVTALTSLVAVLSPIAFRTIFLASGSCIPGLTFASSIDGVARGIIVAVAFMCAIWAESPGRTRQIALAARPSSWTPALSVDVEALKIKAHFVSPPFNTTGYILMYLALPLHCFHNCKSRDIVVRRIQSHMACRKRNPCIPVDTRTVRSCNRMSHSLNMDMKQKHRGSVGHKDDIKSEIRK